VLVAHAAIYGRWIVDDAGITFAYARSVASGAGPVLQVGAEPVEGYSNPAWLALMVFGRWLGLFDHGTWFGVPDYVLYPKLVGGLCCIVAFTGMFLVAQALTAWPVMVTVVAGSITALIPSFAIWSFSGLENSLLVAAVMMLAALVVASTQDRRLLTVPVAACCGLLAGLAALTRPDGLIYAGVYPLVAVCYGLRHQLSRALGMAAISVVLVAVPVGSYVIWRKVTFDELLPNTAIAKAQGLPRVDDLTRPAELLEAFGWLAGGLSIGLLVVGVVRPSRSRAGIRALCVPLFFAFVAYSVLAADWMGQYRFATPVWPLVTIAGGASAAALAPAISRIGRVGLVAAVAAAVAISASRWVDDATKFRAAPTAPLCLVAQNTGHAFNSYARILGVSHGTLLAPDIGGTALTSNLRIVDLAGLADRPIARYWSTGDMAGLRDYIFGTVRPTFIEIHEGWSGLTGLVNDPRLTADYLPIIAPTPITGALVRRSAVGNSAKLTEVQDFAAMAAVPADTAIRTAPRSSCGAQLRPSTR
jgi:hypothetical protein